jgi:hypothetical protein
LSCTWKGTALPIQLTVTEGSGSWPACAACARWAAISVSARPSEGLAASTCRTTSSRRRTAGGAGAAGACAISAGASRRTGARLRSSRRSAGGKAGVDMSHLFSCNVQCRGIRRHLHGQRPGGRAQVSREREMSDEKGAEERQRRGSRPRRDEACYAARRRGRQSEERSLSRQQRSLQERSNDRHGTLGRSRCTAFALAAGRQRPLRWAAAVAANVVRVVMSIPAHGRTVRAGEAGRRSRKVAKRKTGHGRQKHHEQQPGGDDSAQSHGLFIHGSDSSRL